MAKGAAIIGRLKYIIYCFEIIAHQFGLVLAPVMCLFCRREPAVRHISLAGSRDPTSLIFKSLYLLKLHDILNLGVSCFTYRFLNNLLPSNFSHFFEQK